MLEAARNGMGVIAGIDFEHFADATTRELALQRALKLLGEAARRVSPETRSAHPEIPWRLIVGQRNILAHEYGRIDHAQLFRTAAEDLPRLVDMLRTLLPSVDSPG